MKLTTKDYLDAITHWEEIVIAFKTYPNAYDTAFVNCISFYDEYGKKIKKIGYDSYDCAYCTKLKDKTRKIHCELCPLKRCGNGTVWFDFSDNPSLFTAENMLEHIINNPPKGLPKWISTDCQKES